MGEKKSPAIQLIDIVWRCEGHQMEHSWRRRNSVMQDVLKLAIIAGLQFNPEDFEIIASSARDGGFDFGFWGGAIGHMLGESFYFLACTGKEYSYQQSKPFGPNLSACRSFEAWRKRPPFILITPECASGRRLAVDSKFIWKGQEVTCTSFGELGDSITACSYKDVVHARVSIDKRYKITIAELRAHNKLVVAGPSGRGQK